ncbi:hypothetical protein BHU72_10050 [Desulfuribacillus stibiiarsenatis]|uniref:Uncharacterized protein n=1 Tax=Desulfuribacillus stibiiarsenatis TaxID=1390249 RepID=A0A1E5L988_9FIRM|nr:hypothetical protein [Desulfuribacillus stibiiarsenatis]OEH86594.1 hypothetical protein BHU72_10050 [Desulfuribacillus stibiiarsenatis]
MAFVNLKAIQRYALVMLIALLAITILAGCGNQDDEKKGVDQLPPTNQNGNETGDYKDRGDAVNRFHTALENGQPIFLYFYTDT